MTASIITILDDGSIAIGAEASATGIASIAIGSTDGGAAITTGEAAISIGANSGAINDFSVSIGPYTSAEGYGSITLGVGSLASGDSSLCLSTNAAIADGDNSVAIGNGVDALGDYSMALGLSSHSAVNTVLGGAGSLYVVMQDQTHRTLTAANAIMLLGGSLILDPSTGGSYGASITTVQCGIDLSRVHDAMIIPNGTSTQQPGQSGQPTAVNGMIRYNTTSDIF